MNQADRRNAAMLSTTVSGSIMAEWMNFKKLVLESEDLAQSKPDSLYPFKAFVHSSLSRQTQREVNTAQTELNSVEKFENESCLTCA